MYFVQGSTARLHVGGNAELGIPDGMTMQHEAWTHSVENIGDIEIAAVIFELTG